MPAGRPSSIAVAIACAASIVQVAAAPRPAQSRPAPKLDAVLRAAGDYLTAYERDLSAVIAEEDYVQKTSDARYGQKGRTRRLRADIVFMTDATEGWIEIRDVYDVDGQPVRDHDDRIAAIFSKPGAQASERGRAIAQESARFNLDVAGVSVGRTLNVPMAALLYLRAINQARSNFTLDGTDKVSGRETAVVEFAEQAKPRLIGSRDDVAMKGRAWIEPDSGRVLQTELTYVTDTDRPGVVTMATIRVTYAEEPHLHIWLASAMDEKYEPQVSSAQAAIATMQSGPVLSTLSGRATYSDFRRFSVDTNVSTTSPK